MSQLSDNVAEAFRQSNRNHTAELAQALDDAITIIYSIDGRDNSCEPKTDIEYLRVALATART